jgi:hypothetical protein
MLSELTDHVLTGVLASPVSMQILRWGMSVPQCHMQCVRYEQTIMMESNRHTHDLPGISILKLNQVQLLSSIDNLGDVSGPDMTRMGRSYSFEEMDK